MIHWVNCVPSISLPRTRSVRGIEITCDYDSIFDSLSLNSVLSLVSNSLDFTLKKINSSNHIPNFQGSHNLLYHAVSRFLYITEVFL